MSYDGRTIYFIPDYNAACLVRVQADFHISVYNHTYTQYCTLSSSRNFNVKHKPMNAATARNINAVAILGICGLLIGAYYIQFVKGEFPCPLCLLQRVAMLGVALGAMMNLRFGIHPAHYGISILSAVLGACISARQILLHINTPGSGYGSPVFGMHLYTWALIAFIVAVVLI